MVPEETYSQSHPLTLTILHSYRAGGGLVSFMSLVPGVVSGHNVSLTLCSPYLEISQVVLIQKEKESRGMWQHRIEKLINL